jgi:NRPS condensation-like uncharacterized protein
MTSNYINRPLGALEKNFWLTDQTSPTHFVSTAEISGSISVQQWRTALDALQQRHPLFSVAIEGNNYQYPCFRHVEGVQIPLRVAEGNSLANWEKEVARELATPFDWTQAPLVRTVLIRDEQRSTLIMSIYHAIGDGTSFFFIIRDLLQALTGKSLEPLPFPPSIDILLNLTDNHVMEQHSLNTNGDVPALQRKAKPMPHVKRLQLSAQLTDSIVKRAREEGTTVQGALSAAFVRADRQLVADLVEKPIRIRVSSSLRQTLSTGEGCGLYIRSKTIAFDHHKTNFWDIARYGKKELAGINTLVGVSEFTTDFRKLVFSNQDAKEIEAALQRVVAWELVISNLGRLPYETDFGSLKLEAIWGPSCTSGYEGEQFVGISTVNNLMCLMVSSRYPLASLLTTVEQELKAACL